MPTSNQLLSLVKAFYSNDDKQVRNLILQIAAHESKNGHSKLAQTLKDIVAKEKPMTTSIQSIDSELITSCATQKKRTDLIVSEGLSKQLDNIVLEFIHRSKLKKDGYEHRRKILLEGLPGTGKTLTASILSCELGIPLYVIQTDKLISKYMGETGAKLRQIFDMMERKIGVYFFDEFDSIGTKRSLDNDVKEMHRVLNLFLQFIEQDNSDSLIVASTNSGELLDLALFRRFDDVLHYDLPSEEEIRKLFALHLKRFWSDDLVDQDIVNLAIGLCHADITKACENAIKLAILNDCSLVSKELLINMIAERKDIYEIN